MLGIHPRWNHLLVTHLKKLHTEWLIYAIGDVGIDKQQRADDLLLLQSRDLSLEIEAQCE